MRIDLISAVPDLLHSPLQHSILQRAQDRGLVSLHLHNLHHYGLGKHHQIDDYAYGGGPGMVLRVEPLAACIRSLQAQRAYQAVVFMTPDGERLNQSRCNQLALQQNLMVVAGHYKGVDQRAREQLFTHELSIGDFVLSGGELPALVLVDAVCRLLPGVLNDEASALNDSFQSDLLDAPLYTRPPEWEGHSVPEVLLSGNFAEIDKWRDEQAYEKTRRLRPDLLGE